MVIGIDTWKFDGSDHKIVEGMIQVGSINDFHNLIEEPDRNYAFQYRHPEPTIGVNIIFYDCTLKQFYYSGYPRDGNIPTAEREAFPGILVWPTKETE